jgi:hypothetical protein
VLTFEGYTGRKRVPFDECCEICIFPAIADRGGLGWAGHRPGVFRPGGAKKPPRRRKAPSLRMGPVLHALTWCYVGGRYWDRTSDLLGVNEVRFIF